jgi:hypothetical protein
MLQLYINRFMASMKKDMENQYLPFRLLFVPFLLLPGAAFAQSAPAARRAMEVSPAAPIRKSVRFDFGPGKSAAPGYIRVAPAVPYSDERGFGFEEGAADVKGIDRGVPDSLRGDFCTSDQPFCSLSVCPRETTG